MKITLPWQGKTTAKPFNPALFLFSRNKVWMSDCNQRIFIKFGSNIIHMVQKGDNLDSDIILFLLRGESHVRRLAKQLERSHSTVLRRLNDLLEENVLDYKMEGRNRVFFIKKNLQAKTHVFNAEHYKLMNLLKKYPEFGVIVEDILKRCDEKLIIVFGSYAKFMAKKESDIDVFVETRNSRTKEELEAIHSKINAKIGKFDLDSPLIKEIVKNHVILRGVEDFYEKTKLLG
jgi:predicted nucleotidyltransferase